MSALDLGWVARLPASLRVPLDRIDLASLVASVKHVLGARPGRCLVAAVAGYVVLCNALRFRRIKRLQKKLGFTDRSSLARMTGDEAQAILKNMMLLEFPTMYELGLQFALFKTYGIASISKLLVATKNLADKENSSKRYEDTSIIFSEFQVSPPSSKRHMDAVARMNYLHAPYKAAGKISNEDFLYTLAVSAIEPARFITLNEWRAPTEMELCAIGTFWKSLGDAMEIRYDGHLARAGQWVDGIDFLEDVSAWARQYEVDNLRPDQINVPPSRELVRLMSWHIPGPLKPFAQESLVVLMGDRVRQAFLFEEPRVWPAAVVYSAISLRRLALRYFALPRLRELKVFSDEDPATGRIQHYYYLIHPWYNPSTLWSRWGPEAWARRLMGGYAPGDKGFMPQGFLWNEIGPKASVGRGAEEMKAHVQRMEGLQRGKCPFAGAAAA